MADIFLSYARSTAMQAQAGAKALRDLGYSVWLDVELPTHRTYSEVIEEQLASSKATLVIWSAEAVKSQWVKSEANAARQLDKLVQMTIDASRLPMPFDQIQCADLTGWIGDVDAPEWRRVIASIVELVGTPAASSPVLETAPVSSTPARRRHNLPAELTSFIGRERELAEVGELLATHRLVTLVGVGGCGKTRLALAVANAHVEDFSDGVWLVELAPVMDPEQVLPALAKALNIQAMGGLSLRDTVLVTIEDQQRLVVLDNCEHLIDACAELAQALLQKAPGLRMLATSREALGIGGEHPWPISSLAIPDPAQEPTVESLAGIDSVRLFVERAAIVAPRFTVTSGNAVAVARICQRLDGIPLALELAAARVQTLSVDDIAKRLAESFRLLTGGSRAALPRQRTLQATLDWSHALLPEPARMLLRRLSVFANGFTLAAAEAVGGTQPLSADDILDLLTRLVEQSMVQVVTTTSAAPRYRLLEPIRQYAQERLTESGEATATRHRHCDYFVAFAAELFNDYLGPNAEGGVSRRIDLYPRFFAESDNFELALTWCLETDVEKGLQLAANHCQIAFFAGVVNTQWLASFLSRTSASAPGRVWALWALWYVAPTDADPFRRRDVLEEVLALARRDGALQLETQALCRLGLTLIGQGAVDAGEQMIESGLALARAGDANTLGWCLSLMDWHSKPAYEARADECEAAFRRGRNDAGLAQALYRRCMLALEGGPSLSGADDPQFPNVRMLVVHAQQGHAVRRWVEELLELARAHGNSMQIARCLAWLGLLTQQDGDLGGAVQLLERAVEQISNHKHGSWPVPYALSLLLCRLGDHERSEFVIRDFVRECLKYASNVRHALACGLFGLSAIAVGWKEYPRAARLYGASMHLREELGWPVWASETATHEEIVPLIQAALGPDEWRRLCAEGASMTFERATALVMLDEPDAANGDAEARVRQWLR